jgi:hypothetical protein
MILQISMLKWNEFLGTYFPTHNFQFMHLLTILSVTLLMLTPIITALIFWSSLPYTSTAIGIVP